MTDLINTKLRALCLVARKYEPDVSAIQELHKDVYGEIIEYQTAYQALEKLANQGYLQKRSVDGRRNCYMITEQGAERLLEHQQQVQQATRSFRPIIE